LELPLVLSFKKAVSDVTFSLSASARFLASIRRLARSICFLLEATNRFLRFEFGISLDHGEKAQEL
jgi:hypothetical protein